MMSAKLTEQEERFVHFVSCIEDLNDAWRVLKKINSSSRNSLRGVAFKYALIAYSRPFKQSRGTVVGRHSLNKDHVPEMYLELHESILKARDTILGHTDLTVREATLHRYEHAHGKDVLIGANVVHGTELYPQLKSIIELIEKSLDSMYKEEKRLKAEVASTR